MWACKKCGEIVEDQFDKCWNCSAPKPDLPPAAAPPKPGWRLNYRIFRGTLATWDALFSEAAEFATEVGPERLACISHSEDNSDGVVTVWYWAKEGEAQS